MRKKRKPSEQQRELFAPPALPEFEAEQEAINDRLRDEFLAEREAREDKWRELEGPEVPIAEQKVAGQQRMPAARPNVTKRLLARSADRNRRKAAERQFQALSTSRGQKVN